MPNTQVIMDTSHGTIKIELEDDKAPISVKNFLAYVDEGFYNGTIFHRVIPNFMIQGGGFEPGMTQKQTKGTIKNESANGLSNKRGTLAMARTNVADSATAQFFINITENTFLDRANSKDGVGYCVFGRVIDGMTAVDAIKAAATGTRGGHGDVPKTDILITSMRRA